MALPSIDQARVHPNEVGPRDVPRLHIGICPRGCMLNSYGPLSGPGSPGLLCFVVRNGYHGLDSTATPFRIC